MFNPFVLFSEPLLQAFIGSGKKFFVRQSFSRQKDAAGGLIKACFIFTHYAEMGHAQHHYDAISQDAYRHIYEWENPEEQTKLITAARQPDGYRIYSSVFKMSWEKDISPAFKEKLRNYIGTNVDWKPSVRETVAFEIYASYGELYAQLKFGRQEVRVKLEEIENFR